MLLHKLQNTEFLKNFLHEMQYGFERDEIGLE